METNQLVEKPKKVKNGVKFLYYGLLIYVISGCYSFIFNLNNYYSLSINNTYKMSFHAFSLEFVIVRVIMFLIFLYIIYKISKGSGTSRNVLLVLFILFVLDGLWISLGLHGLGIIPHILGYVFLILFIIGFVFLYSSPSRKWFHEKKKESMTNKLKTM